MNQSNEQVEPQAIRLRAMCSQRGQTAIMQHKARLGKFDDDIVCLGARNADIAAVCLEVV